VLKFLARRFANYLVLVALAVTVGYFLAGTSLNARAGFEGRNPPPPKASVDQTLNELNLNNETPVRERFVTWVKGVLHGDFGTALVSRRPITDEMPLRMGVSLRLLLLGAILGVVLGVTLGVVSAVKQYQATDYLATFGSFLVLSTPVFLLGVLLKYGALNINQRSGTTFLYLLGEYNPEKLGAGFWTEAVDRLKHIILPTLSITLGGVAFYSRYQRNSMLDVLGSDFLRTAQAKGLRRRTALVKHGLRTALIPLATFFAYGFTLLITGATFTEKIFGWHGMGEWFIDSVQANDVNVVMAVLTLDAVLILIAGMLADLVHAALDPRVRIR
jgi:peptide/nickel transport system permease protein